MPSLTSRDQQAPSEELRESPSCPGNSGPWGGIQSEMAPSDVERYGLLDTSNIIFNRGLALGRPGLRPLPAYVAPTNRTVLGFMDFYNSAGVRVQLIPTLQGAVQWTGIGFPPVGGPAFGGSAVPFAWTVLNQKVCFTQGLLPTVVGTTPLMTWDGIAANYVAVGGASPAALALAEIDTHLMFGNTVEGGVQFPQRYRWSGVGDPTDYTSFSAGTNDLLIDLGPIYNIKKLGQYGFSWHAGGIVQITPTGIGTAPFAFRGLNSSYCGTPAPWSIDKFNYQGTDCAAYVGPSNVYIFDQSSVIPIGDAPIDGNRRVGARKRIFADLATVPSSFRVIQAVGVVTQSIGSDPNFAYWLLVSSSIAWVYHFDEGNWSRQTFNGVGQVFGRMITVNNNSNFEDFLGFSLPSGMQALDGQITCENPISMTSGQLEFDDKRHSDTVKKVRVIVNDQGPCTYTLTLSNNKGQSVPSTFTLGNTPATGVDLSIVLPFTINGLNFSWTLSSAQSQPFAVVEVKPMYDIGGEQRSGTVDGN